eukprot:gene38789-47173_t
MYFKLILLAALALYVVAMPSASLKLQSKIHSLKGTSVNKVLQVRGGANVGPLTPDVILNLNIAACVLYALQSPFSDFVLKRFYPNEAVSSGAKFCLLFTGTFEFATAALLVLIKDKVDTSLLLKWLAGLDALLLAVPLAMKYACQIPGKYEEIIAVSAVFTLLNLAAAVL